jgi:7,8-dihydroneopterin aldolase/epimerase/oxygenase
MSILQLTGIKAYGYIGHSAEEKILGQWFEVDVKITMDTIKASMSDNLHDTLDYREIITGIKNIITNNKFNLVERLTEVLVQFVLSFEQVNLVNLRLHKLHPPIDGFDGKITIEIERSK